MVCNGVQSVSSMKFFFFIIYLRLLNIYYLWTHAHLMPNYLCIKKMLMCHKHISKNKDKFTTRVIYLIVPNKLILF